jgi:hypothetical protein
VAAGDNYIFLGGDTWVKADLGTELDNSGSSGNPIYLGVDKTWFAAVTGTCTISGSTCTWVSGLRAPAACPTIWVSGSNCFGDFGYLVSGNTITLNSTSCTLSVTPAPGSTNALSFTGCSPGSGTVSFSYSYWTRPIWTCGGTACSGTGNEASYFTVFGTYTTVDSIEFTGMDSDGSPLYYGSYNGNNVLENCYMHGWTNTGGSSDAGVAVTFSNGSGPSVNSGIHDCIIDGSDTAMDSLQAVSGFPNFMYDDVFEYVTNEFQNSVSVVHDSYFGPLVASFASGQHQNQLQIAGVDNSETYQLIYNNLITGTTFTGGGGAGGAVKLWFNQGANPGVTGWVFNNLIYGNTPGNYIDFCAHTAVNCGTWNFFSNTVECGTDASPGSGSGGCGSDSGGEAGTTFTFNHGNNHIITNASPPFACTYGTCGTILNADVVQSVATANSQGYTSTSTFAFQPTSGSGSTVGAGASLTTVCGNINSLSNSYSTTAYNACLKSTGYACSYNTNNATVSCPDLAEVARPSTSPDIGAYQFSGSVLGFDSINGLIGKGFILQ